MSIHKVNPILIHPFLLLPAPKCLHMNQFCGNNPEIYFLVFYIIYLPKLYNTQAPRPLAGVHSTGIPPIYTIYIPIMYAFWAIKINLGGKILHLPKLQGPLTIESPGDEQGMLDCSPRDRGTN